MRKEQFSIGKKQLKVPIIQGGMGVGISLGGLAGATIISYFANALSNACLISAFVRSAFR